jgi:hypothetical protein
VPIGDISQLRQKERSPRGGLSESKAEPLEPGANFHGPHDLAVLHEVNWAFENIIGLFDQRSEMDRAEAKERWVVTVAA